MMEIKGTDLFSTYLSLLLFSRPPLRAALDAPPDSLFDLVNEALRSGELPALQGFADQAPLALWYRFAEKLSIALMPLRFGPAQRQISGAPIEKPRLGQAEPLLGAGP